MGWFRRLRSTWSGARWNHEFEEEARFHLDELTDELVRQGLPHDQARQRAQRRLGNMTLTRDRTRDADSFRWLSDAAQDTRFAARTLVKQPGFALVAILTLALGIGANSAIFTLFDAILLRQLPVTDPSRLVLFSDEVGEGTSTGDPPTDQWTLFSWDVYRHLRDQPLGFSELAAVRSGESTVLAHLAAAGGPAEAQRAQAHLVSGNYFSTLGVDAALGRLLTPADDAATAPPVAVVSDGFWHRKLNADPSIIGRAVVLNQTTFTVVGVTPPEFYGERVRRPPDFWMPLRFQPGIELRVAAMERTDWYWLSLIGRLAPGTSAAQAQTATTAALQRYLTSQAGSSISDERGRAIRGSHVALFSGANGISGLRALYSQPLHILLGVVALVLMIACANVANLLLTRAAARRNEISMRIALGASRARLVRQLLTESLLLAGLGAGCGILIASWAARALLSLVASPTAPVAASINGTVLIFTLAIAVGAGLIFGIAPAFTASQVDLVAGLKTRHGSGAAASGRSRTAPALVTAQIAVSLVLLVGASLFARTLLNVQSHPLGFEPDHVVLARLNPLLAGYKPETAIAMYRRLYDRLRALPGVEAVTMARYSPFGGSNSAESARIDGYTPRPGESVTVESIIVGPTYPDTMGIRLVRGRAFDLNDGTGRQHVTMVNEAFVRRYFASADPIGRHIGFDDSRAPDMEIVGVLADARFHDVQHPVAPAVFTPILQETSAFALDAELALRTTTEGSTVSDIRRVVAEIDPNLPLNDPRALSAQVSTAFNTQRLAARFVGFFGLLALTLAAVGLYGAIAQNVMQRTSEIGVRLALGAARSEVLWMILRQTCLLLVTGLAIGLPAAALAARLIASQLFGIRPMDAASFAAAGAVLAVVALIAGAIPARRATLVDPITALRSQG